MANLFNMFGNKGPSNYPNNPINLALQMMQSGDPMQNLEQMYKNGQIDQQQYEFIKNGAANPEQTMRGIFNQGIVPQNGISYLNNMAQMFSQFLGRR